MARAAGIVAMGGYNTFCEILSFDKPALIVPRTEPRLEQYIRASRAQATRADPHAVADERQRARAMAAALRACRRSRALRRCAIPGLLDGLEVIGGCVDRGSIGPAERVAR